eukprot:TRINITY_DN79_c0_g1_i10.p1 TRINITY_DN79_c0_g1~~TRINITY_DN79_c0_g1_i10.p1  ORF type:complete len:378 (-),score=66.28 TRINITY_DN79_c0_g1_i10:311-1444(-)
MAQSLCSHLFIKTCIPTMMIVKSINYNATKRVFNNLLNKQFKRNYSTVETFPSVMKAVRVHAVGGIDALKYENVPTPLPQDTEVLVRNEAIGLNYIDTYHRNGLYKLPLPAILGREAAGVVVSVGSSVKNVKVGDKVAYCLVPGAYADYTAVPSWKAFKLPNKFSTEIAATSLLQGLTAHYLTKSTYPLSSGKTALIHAGAGGLGQILIQMSKNLGAKVITTVGSKEKEEIVLKLGADHVINYNTQKNFSKNVRELTNGKGVDVVYDSVGKTTFEGSLLSLAKRGYLVLCGNASGPTPPIDPLLLSEKGSLYVTRPTLVDYIADPQSYNERTDDLFQMIAAGKITLQSPVKFPLVDVARAHELLESRKTTGKVILIP